MRILARPATPLRAVAPPAARRGRPRRAGLLLTAALAGAASCAGPEGRIASLGAQARDGSPEAVAKLAAWSRDEDEYAARLAVEALGGAQGPGVAEALIAALGHRRSVVRREAADSLGRHGGPGAVKPLVDALHHEGEPWARVSMAKAVTAIVPDYPWGDERRMVDFVDEELGGLCGKPAPLDSLEGERLSADIWFLGLAGDETSVATLNSCRGTRAGQDTRRWTTTSSTPLGPGQTWVTTTQWTEVVPWTLETDTLVDGAIQMIRARSAARQGARE